MSGLLQQGQVFLYLAAVFAGVSIGLVLPGDTADGLEVGVWPVLALLLFGAFLQVEPRSLRSHAFRGRFLAAALTANFLLVPGVVALLVALAPDDDAIRLGLALVLLAPCTDWFVAFTLLGRGNAALAVELTPLLLLLQMLLLPLYAWLILGTGAIGELSLAPFLWAFFGLILLPFVAAMIVRHHLTRRASGASWLVRAEYAVPLLLAAVLLLVSASQVDAVRDEVRELLGVILLCVAYAVVALLMARLVVTFASLPYREGRTLAFNLGSRNSFVILPLVLVLPVGWELAVAVVVLQSLVELLALIGYLAVVPRYLFPSREGDSSVEA